MVKDLLSYDKIMKEIGAKNIFISPADSCLHYDSNNQKDTLNYNMHSKECKCYNCKRSFEVAPIEDPESLSKLTESVDTIANYIEALKLLIDNDKLESAQPFFNIVTTLELLPSFYQFIIDNKYFRQDYCPKTPVKAPNFEIFSELFSPQVK